MYGVLSWVGCAASKRHVDSRLLDGDTFFIHKPSIIIVVSGIVVVVDLLLLRLFQKVVRFSFIRLGCVSDRLLRGLDAGNKQHTFIETDTVRYVYQPIENLFLLLVTNKASNIVEDLETLRMLSKGGQFL